MQRGDQESDAGLGAWLVGALIVLLGTFAIYAKVGGFEFVLFDDDAYVYSNAVVSEGLSADGVRWAFTEAHSNNWHPLTWLSHMLDVELFGLEAGPHHWVSVCLHACAAVLLLFLCGRIGLGLWGALLVALAFAWHPLRVESVAWVSERKDVLSGVFALITLHAYVSYARRGGAKRYALVLASLALGLLAKPMLVTLPFVLLLLDLWPLERWSRETARRCILEKLPLIALAVASGITTVLVQRASGAVQGFESIPLVPRLENAAWSVWVYPAQTLIPRGLGILYPHPALGSSGAWLHAQGTVALLGILVVSVLAWKRREAAPWILVGWLWYGIMLMPVAGVLQVGEQAHADRYAYLPTIGLLLALAAAFELALSKRPTMRTPAVLASTAVLAVYAVLAHVQTEHWRDSEALFRRSLAVTGGNYQAHLNLGMWLRQSRRLDEALVETRAAAALRPDALEGLYNLGVQEQAAGNTEAALNSFRRAVEADPTSADAHNRLAQIELGRGAQDAAAYHFEQAAANAEERVDLQSNLARFRAAFGDLAGAREPFERALRLSGGSLPWEDLRLLARARSASGDPAGAMQLLRELRAERPGDPAVAIDLAWVLATTPDEGLRDAEAAERLARQLLAAPGAPRASLLPLLAAAQAAGGSFEAAVATQREALGLADPGARSLEQARLEAYVTGAALFLTSPW